MLINKDNSILMIIDVQERLAPVMENPRDIITGAAKLLEVAKILGVPYLVTEQYPKGLGETIFDIKEHMNNELCFAKTAFSCGKDETIYAQIKAKKKKQVILVGLETHICVLQTALDLLSKGYEVFVVADACGSRDLHQSSLAFQRLIKNGAEVVSTEMVIFEWLEDAKNENFKEISKKFL